MFLALLLVGVVLFPQGFALGLDELPLLLVVQVGLAQLRLLLPDLQFVLEDHLLQVLLLGLDVLELGVDLLLLGLQLQVGLLGELAVILEQALLSQVEGLQGLQLRL